MGVPRRSHAGFERHGAGLLQPVAPVPVLEPQHRQAGVEALLVVPDGFEHPLHDADAGRAHAQRPPAYAVGVPVAVALALRQVRGDRGVPVPRVRGEGPVGRDPLAAQVDLDERVGDAQVDPLAYVPVADGVEVALPADMAVELHLAPVHPPADLIGNRRKGPEQGLLLLDEALQAAAVALLERRRVVRREPLGDRGPEVAHAGEGDVAQPGDDLGRDVAHRALGARLVFRGPDPGSHDGGRVVGRQRLVGLVEDDLALLGVPGDAGLEVVGDYHWYRTAEELEHPHMAAKPRVLGHVQGGLHIGVPAEREGGDEEVHLRDLAGHGVHDRHRGPRPVDLADPGGLVADPAGDLLGHGEGPVALAEPVVAHGHLAVLRADVTVLQVEQLQRDAHLRQLPVDVFPVGLLEHADVVVAVREEQPVDLVVRHVGDVGVGDAQLRGRLQNLPLALLRDPVGLVDLVGRDPGLAKLEGQLRTYLVRHVLFLSSRCLAWRPERYWKREPPRIAAVTMGNNDALSGGNRTR